MSFRHRVPVRVSVAACAALLLQSCLTGIEAQGQSLAVYDNACDLFSRVYVSGTEDVREQVLRDCREDDKANPKRCVDAAEVLGRWRTLCENHPVQKTCEDASNLLLAVRGTRLLQCRGSR